MTAHLPDCENARIEDAKLYQYLLNLEHLDGKSKARFYEQVGYTTANGEQLRNDLLGLACLGIVQQVGKNRLGLKYVVVGPISAPNGKAYPILSVWAVEAPDHRPRLITAYPN